MKRITCILLTCILCFSISGCTKTYKGTDELIEKAREEIPVSVADTIDMQYGGMCTVDDTALGLVYLHATNIRRITTFLWK